MSNHLLDADNVSLNQMSMMRKRARAYGVVLLLLFLTAIPATSQDLSGRYEGVAKTQSHGDVPLVLELRQEKGTFGGSLNTAFGNWPVTGGTYKGEVLTLRVESYDDDGIIAVSLKGSKLTGELEGFGEKGRVELTRTGPPSPAPDMNPVGALSKEKWREDLKYLAEELPRRHKNAFHMVTRDQFNRAVAELDARIPTLSDSDIVMGLSRITAMIGDGHTNLRWGRLYPQVPLRLYWFGKELRVTETSASYRRALGARVVKIGNASAAEALKLDQPFISQDESPGFVLSVNADLMACPAHLHALGLAPDTTHARYTFADDRGKRFTLDLKALAPGEQMQWLDAAQKRPLYRQRPGEPLWYSYLPEAQTLYLNFNGYPRRKVLDKFSVEFFDFLDHHEVRRVIVDMRQNGGGDFTRGRDFIISKFKQRPTLTGPGHLYVVIGRWTYSAGMSNAADFRNDLHAILVGEPTGARPNGYQENREFSLPNSHLGVSYSTQLYKFQDQDTPGIMLDHRIDPDWASYKAGRDPVLEWILARP